MKESFAIMFRRLFMSAFILLIWVAPVGAQSPFTLTELQIRLWPEYDQPAMLVIYSGTLSTATPLPAILQFTIPAQPLVVAYANEQGQLFDLEFDAADLAGGVLLTFSTPSHAFQFEYYDTTLNLSQSDRQYTFSAIAPYAVQSLMFEVQQPIDASALSATPALGASTVGRDGLTYYSTAPSAVTSGSLITFNLTYTKTTDALTAGATRSAATPDLPEPLMPLITDPLLIGLSIAAVVSVIFLAAVFGYYRLRESRSELPEPQLKAKSKGQPPKPRPVGPPPREPEPALYCHACGHAAQPGDRFCRKCGTELRR
jgi:hypothetical protein